MPRIIRRSGRDASPPKESASVVLSSVSPLHNPTALTCPNARSTLTDPQAGWSGGGGGGGEARGGGTQGTWMNEGEQKSPSFDWQAESAPRERGSSRVFRVCGHRQERFPAPPHRVLEENRIWTSRRRRRRRTELTNHDYHHPSPHLSPLTSQSAAAKLWNGRARAPPLHVQGITRDTELKKKNPSFTVTLSSFYIEYQMLRFVRGVMWRKAKQKFTDST